MKVTPALAAGAIAPGLALRVADPADRRWLFEWHKSAYRGHIERLWRWDDLAQRRDFEERFRLSPPLVVVVDACDAGYLQARLDAQQLHLENIVLVERARNRGVGRCLLERLQQRAATDAVPMTLRVFRTNRSACRLYARLGFRDRWRRHAHRHALVGRRSRAASLNATKYAGPDTQRVRRMCNPFSRLSAS